MAVDWTDESAAATALRDRGVESDLSDAALHAFALAAVGEIADRIGTRSGIAYAVPYDESYGRAYIFLSPPASTVTSIEESGETLVADTDYRVVYGGRAVERLAETYSSSWDYPITITYDAAAVTDTDRYDRVVVDLVKLAISYGGFVHSVSDGDHSESASLTSDGYQRERDALISELAPVEWGVA